MKQPKDKITREIRSYNCTEKIPENAVYLTSLVEHTPVGKIEIVKHYFILHLPPKS